MVLKSEVRLALAKMDRKKAEKPDEIVIEMMLALNDTGILLIQNDK